MTTTRVHRCLDSGLSVLVGTVDAQGRPLCCRATAIASDDALETVTVYVPLATSHETIQNLATTKKVAVTATHIVEHRATQLKGTTVEARLAREDEAPFVRERHEAFAAVLERIGVPRRLAVGIAHWPAFAVTLRVEQVFDQSPGPNAGAQLR